LRRHSAAAVAFCPTLSALPFYILTLENPGDVYRHHHHGVRHDHGGP
jgi:hypothetical protein